MRREERIKLNREMGFPRIISASFIFILLQPTNAYHQFAISFRNKWRTIIGVIWI